MLIQPKKRINTPDEQNNQCPLGIPNLFDFNEHFASHFSVPLLYYRFYFVLGQKIFLTILETLLSGLEVDRPIDLNKLKWTKEQSLIIIDNKFNNFVSKFLQIIAQTQFRPVHLFKRHVWFCSLVLNVLKCNFQRAQGALWVVDADPAARLTFELVLDP